MIHGFGGYLVEKGLRGQDKHILVLGAKVSRVGVAAGKVGNGEVGRAIARPVLEHDAESQFTGKVES